jgi:hypothetical protein
MRPSADPVSSPRTYFVKLTMLAKRLEMKG